MTDDERTRFVARMWRVARFSGIDVLAYCFDRNPVKAKMDRWPDKYEWCSFAAACKGEERCIDGVRSFTGIDGQYRNVI